MFIFHHTDLMSSSVLRCKLCLFHNYNKSLKLNSGAVVQYCKKKIILQIKALWSYLL